MPVTVRPTGADIAIARAITRNTKPAPEAVARALTWGAEKNVLLVLAVAGWLASRGRSAALRRASALIRGLASLPLVPLMPGTEPLQVVQLSDIVATDLFFIKPGAPSHIALELPARSG